MHKKLSRDSKDEILEQIKVRYFNSTKAEKTVILDELCNLMQCHRKHAIRLLKGDTNPSSGNKGQHNKVYNEATKEALIVLWEASDRICSKRLKVMIPDLLYSLEYTGHLTMDPLVKESLMNISPATIDRLLKDIRGKGVQKKKKNRPSKTKSQILVKTFSEWDKSVPGELEIDFVLHHGGSVKGSFIHTLVATDVYSGWTECVPLLAREQSLATEGLRKIKDRLPFPIIGINTDNDGAFINDTLIDFCKFENIVFTRSRAYKKNDQAWIEQKNGAVVRKLVGDHRYCGINACRCLNGLYQANRIYMNYFQPSFKLVSKSRDGAKVKKVYDKPSTPCDRLLAYPNISDLTRSNLIREKKMADPIVLLKDIRSWQQTLMAIHENQPVDKEHKELREYLSDLSILWKDGEARPTHQKLEKPVRWWKTRKDPFETSWPLIVDWLEQNPELTAKDILDRLLKEFPNRFEERQIRTLQRKVKDWRSITANKLIYLSSKEMPFENSEK